MERRTNIKVVAELAGVSISTVSRVLNNSASVSDELKEKVYKAIKNTGYSINPIASTLKSTRRNQIAIVIPSLRQIHYTDIIKGASDYAYEREVFPVILETSGDLEKEKNIIENLEKQWVDGIIFIPSKKECKEEYLEFAASLSLLSKNQEKIPVVLVDSDGVNDDLDCVRVDYEYAFSVLASHLLEIGRKNIAFLGGMKNAPMYDLSLKGMKSAFAEYDCVLVENCMMECGFTVLDGYRAMNALLDRDIKIDGVICSNEQIASGALRACNERNILVPQNIAITGFGGVALSIITTPSLTTMIVPRYEEGYQAAALLFDRIDGQISSRKKVVLKPNLSIRDSTLKTAFKTMDLMFDE